MTQRLKETTAAMDRAIGQRIKQFRILQGRSQEWLGNQLGITFQQVQKYETGRNRIAVSTLVLISRALHISPMDVIGVELGEYERVEDLALLAQRNRELEATLEKIGRLAGLKAPVAPAAFADAQAMMPAASDPHSYA